jgi:uncharacterized protein YcfJ
MATSKLRKVCTASLAVLLVGCAGPNYRPIIDTARVDFNQYERDLRDCQGYATQTANAAQTAAVGAAAGAIFGLALGAIVGHGVDKNAMTGAGALFGAVDGAGHGETNQRDIIRRCLANRGYSVLQ